MSMYKLSIQLNSNMFPPFSQTGKPHKKNCLRRRVNYQNLMYLRQFRLFFRLLPNKEQLIADVGADAIVGDVEVAV
jgi:hypothetical protein